VSRVFLVLWLLFGLSACMAGSARTELGAAGRELYVDVGCSACHGGRGEGRVGPGLAGVIETFSTCADQLEWVSKGSDAWEAERGPVYGSGKPVQGGMPGFGEALSDEELRTVVAYTRFEFAGGAEDEVREDCNI